jgi:hypothetical protein
MGHPAARGLETGKTTARVAAPDRRIVAADAANGGR